MKTFIILGIFLLNISFGDTLKKTSNEKKILDSISELSIKIGSGTSKVVNIFVDPKCKYSRKMITKITKSKMLQLTNTYNVFLYGLPRLKSEKLIAYILESKDRLSALKKVMVEKYIIYLENFNPKERTLRTIQKISNVGKELKMSKRPYLISFEKDSKYCYVSEGEASCIEEF